jgi:hypothetical protein
MTRRGHDLIAKFIRWIEDARRERIPNYEGLATAAWASASLLKRHLADSCHRSRSRCPEGHCSREGTPCATPGGAAASEMHRSSGLRRSAAREARPSRRAGPTRTPVDPPPRFVNFDDPLLATKKKIKSAVYVFPLEMENRKPEILEIGVI